MELGAAREIRMQDHDRAAIAFQEGMRVRQRAEHRSGLGAHARRVRRHVERVFGRPAHVGGMREQIRRAALADGDVGRERRAVLSRPGIVSEGSLVPSRLHRVRRVSGSSKVAKVSGPLVYIRAMQR